MKNASEDEHEARRLLRLATEQNLNNGKHTALIQEAQVHATLAVLTVLNQILERTPHPAPTRVLGIPGGDYL